MNMLNINSIDRHLKQLYIGNYYIHILKILVRKMINIEILVLKIHSNIIVSKDHTIITMKLQLL